MEIGTLKHVEEAIDCSFRAGQVTVAESKVRKVFLGATGFFVVFNGLAVPLPHQICFDHGIFLFLETWLASLAAANCTPQLNTQRSEAKLPFALPKLRRFLGAPYVPMKRNAVEALSGACEAYCLFSRM